MRQLRGLVEVLVVHALYSQVEVVDKHAVLKALSTALTAEPPVCVGSIPPLSQASSVVSGGNVHSETFAVAKEAFDRNYHENMLRRTRGDVSEAARMAGESVKNFRRKLRKFKISAKAYRGR